MTIPVLETPRLILRPWEARDRDAFAAMNADPRVMEHFPTPLSRDASDALMDRLTARAGADGIGFAAVERKAGGAIIGMVGLARVGFKGPLQGALEIGWRLAPAHWRRGYASEAARRWLDHGFEVLAAGEIVAFAVPANAPSLAVMERLGMVRDPARGFERPALPEGHRLRPHVLYALSRAAWAAG